MATYTRQLWRAKGSETLFSVKLVVQSAFTLSATDYWTVTVRRRRAAADAFGAQTTGETVGSTYSLATRSLSADDPVTLYEETLGLDLGDGDSLVAVAESTGSPAALDDPRLILDIQRNTR